MDLFVADWYRIRINHNDHWHRVIGDGGAGDSWRLNRCLIGGPGFDSGHDSFRDEHDDPVSLAFPWTSVLTSVYRGGQCCKIILDLCLAIFVKHCDDSGLFGPHRDQFVYGDFDRCSAGTRFGGGTDWRNK